MSCPRWLNVTIELPPGYDAATIDRSSVRLAGTVAADSWSQTTDEDHDGRLELQVRFAFGRVAPLLAPGRNVLSVTGKAGGVDFAGQATVDVAGLAGRALRDTAEAQPIEPGERRRGPAAGPLLPGRQAHRPRHPAAQRDSQGQARGVGLDRRS